MLNRIIIMGRLTADPELRTTPNGISVASFRVAVDRNYSRQGEERQTDFIPVVAWRERAEFVNKYFRKGSMIAVEGSLQSRTYEDKATGGKRTAYDVVADNVSFCGSRAESGTAGGGSYGNAQQQQQPAERSSYSNAQAEDFSTVLDDDLPF